MREKINVKTGGKLYIAGEYSVLTPGQSAIIKNIDIFMNAEISFLGESENRNEEKIENVDMRFFLICLIIRFRWSMIKIIR